MNLRRLLRRSWRRHSSCSRPARSRRWRRRLPGQVPGGRRGPHRRVRGLLASAHRARDKGLQDMVSQFNSSNPYKVTVKSEYAGAYNDIYNKMITAIAAGSMPNLVVAYQNQAAGYQVAKALVDMDVYVQDANGASPRRSRPTSSRASSCKTRAPSSAA